MTSSRRIIRTLDCDYLYPRFAAAYLLRDGSDVAFVDNNTSHCVPKLLEALKEEGLTPEQVRFVIVTHVHLDHAGGTQALMDACPRATLLAHPKAAPHLIDPSKLVESAKKVYGTGRFQALYGQMGPVNAERVKCPLEGEAISFGSGQLRFMHTRGHANHHFCIFWPEESAIFTGDSFGLCYPDLQTRGLFIFPSTSPTGFEPEEALNSIARIVATGASRAFPTHFGEVRDLARAAEQLITDVTFSARVLEEASGGKECGARLESLCAARLRSHMKGRLGKLGLDEEDYVWKLLNLDLELNAQGVAFAAEKLRSKK